jgi:hypothetical protein
MSSVSLSRYNFLNFWKWLYTQKWLRWSEQTYFTRTF